MEITTTMIVQDNEIKEFTCFTCQKRFPLIGDLTRHLTTEHKPNPSLALLAPKPKTLRNVEFEGNVNSEAISMEPVSTEGEEEAASTSKQIASRFRFFCSVCNRGFALKHHVVRHEEKIHNIVRPKMRQQNFLDSTPKTVVYVPNEVGGLTSHLQTLHQEPSISSTTDLTSPGLVSGSYLSKPRSHICEVCAKGFTQRHHLKRHMERAHRPQAVTDDQEVTSESCLAVVPVTLSETDGVIVARPEKPLHRCSSCYRGFTERHHMIRHEKTVHESKKDHHCILCGKHFSQKHHLLNHQIAIHCKTRNYSCSVCSKKFSLKHQLQRHEKRVHNTQILADGTVIKKRRQKKEIGPDGKPRITWVGGEVIGFAGPPGDAVEGGEVRQVGENDAESAKTANHTNNISRDASLEDNVDADIGKGGKGEGGGEATCVIASKNIQGSTMVSNSSSVDEPLLPVVEGEEKSNVEALLSKLTDVKQFSVTSLANSPTTADSTANQFSHVPTPVSQPVRSTSTNFSAPTTNSMKGSSQNLTHSHVAPNSSVNEAVNVTAAAMTNRGGLTGLHQQHSSGSDPSSMSTPVSPPSTPTTISSMRLNPTTPKHQFLPHSLFSSPPSAGFQASPFFHMASNVISGLAPMDAVADANRKWAFLGEGHQAASAVGTANHANSVTPSHGICNYQGLTSNPTATPTSFLPPQSPHFSNATFPISMTPHQTPQSHLHFPPL